MVQQRLEVTRAEDPASWETEYDRVVAGYRESDWLSFADDTGRT